MFARLVLGLSLAAPVSLASPASAIAAPTESEPARVRVVVKADELGETSEVYEEVVGDRLRAALEEAGYALDDSVRADATVRVRISFFNEVDLDYQVETDISAGAQIVQLETLGCPQCVDEDLIAKIDSQQPQIFTGLERALARAGEDREPRSSPETNPSTEPSSESPRRITALGGVGIGVAALGVGAVIAGGVELARGRVDDEVSRTPTEISGLDHRPLGAALLGGGGVLLTAGVTMLVVDLIKLKKQRSKRQPTTTAHPLLGPEIVGMGVTGHF